MPLTATMSIMGLYQWDNSIFDLLQLPNGIDKNTLVNIILTRFANLEIMYPNPEVMKGLIGLWSYSSQYTWSKLLETTTLQYNPLDNYDRTETRTLNSSANGSSADSGSDNMSSTEAGETSNSSSETNKAQVAGFNSSANTFTDKDKQTNENTSSGSYSKQNEATTNYGHKNNNTYNKNDTETIRARGNIGVTSSMQLIEAQRELVKFNIYDFIADDFKKRYCILVY